MATKKGAKASKTATKKTVKSISSKGPAKSAKPGATKKPSSDALLFHAMYLMAVIDGTTSSSELHVLEALLTSLPEFSASSISELVAESKAIVKKYGGTIDSLEALADVDGMKARIKCFLLATEVAYASGGIGKAEAALLETLAKLLDLDKSVTKSIVTVLTYKYQDVRG
ncbi:MAG: tellurite resistance TerB family protein [Polyangiaceae bacterium]|nr:tellurite resistance TerB family protein [Polyangiaceae bacterium]